MDNVQFSVKLWHDEPVDVIDMANSLISLSQLATESIGRAHGIEDVKIMLGGVKEGSDEYQMILAFGAATLPFIEYANSVMSFTEYISKFLTVNNKSIKEIQDDDDLNISNASKIKNIMKPIVSDGSANYAIITGDNSPVTILNITHAEAKEIVENANMVQKIKEVPQKVEEQDEYTKVLIEMHKTTNTSKKVKDTAYCDKIEKGKAIPTLFENKKDKEQVLEDPYNNLFLVDIEAERQGGRVKLYRVTKLHNIVPIEENN